MKSVDDVDDEENGNDVAQVQYESSIDDDDDDHDVSVGEVSEEVQDIVGDEIGGKQESILDSTTVLEDSTEQKESKNEEGEPYQLEEEEEEEEEDEVSEQEQKQHNEEEHTEADEGESQENMPSMDELVPEEQESQNQNGNKNDNRPSTNTDWEPYHILHPKNKDDHTNPSMESSLTSRTIGTVVSLSFFAATSFFVCICCLRYYSRRRKSHFHGSHPHNRYGSNANNNKYYSALHGSDDFFDGTFSDDVSYFEKDSDDDEEDYDDDDYDTLPMNYSHDSDDDVHNVSSRNGGGGGGGGVRLEMRGRNVSNGVMHESLTLDECNG